MDRHNILDKSDLNTIGVVTSDLLALTDRNFSIKLQWRGLSQSWHLCLLLELDEYPAIGSRNMIICYLLLALDLDNGSKNTKSNTTLGTFLKMYLCKLVEIKQKRHEIYQF